MSLSDLSPTIVTRFNSIEVWAGLREADRHLAELKGVCDSIPNPSILLSTLSLQEAKDSSEVENIVTTYDEIYTSSANEGRTSAAAKEVQNYVSALRLGFDAVKDDGLIRLKTIERIHGNLEMTQTGLRKLPGTVLRNERTGEVVYEPPQSGEDVRRLMGNLVDFMNDDGVDPLLRMVVAHHQFESIHPFYDGNGRTGRILIPLMLVRDGLLHLPVLYLSRYITRQKADYYRLLQAVRQEDQWVEWALFLLEGVAETARQQVRLVRQLRQLIQDYKHRIRSQLPKVYSQDLINNLFRYPYTRIQLIANDLGVSRPTATRYLSQLTEGGFVDKYKLGKTNYYVNAPLVTLLTSVEKDNPENRPDYP